MAAITRPTPGGMTQTERLIHFLRTHPQATSLEITLACGIVNTTGRISDARAQGIDIECITRSDGRKGYVVNEKPTQTVLW